ncbi:unnamed protein product [Discula destructiva]
MPKMQYRIEEVPGGKVTHQSRPVKDKEHYCTIIAVVRLRNTAEEDDYVRLYNVVVNHYVPRGRRHIGAIFVNDDWSVEQQDHSYMYYVRTPPMPPAAITGVEVIRDET